MTRFSLSGLGPGAWLALLALVGGNPAAQGQEVSEPSIPVWRDGREVGSTTRSTAARDGYLVVDLGEVWVPYVLSGETDPPHAYASVFRALGREDFPDDHHGLRARLDRYLELYGIPPTLSVLRERFQRIALSRCRPFIDLEAIRRFEGTTVDEDDPIPDEVGADVALESWVRDLIERDRAWDPGGLDLTRLDPRERRLLDLHRRAMRWRHAIGAIRYRLACEGHLRGEIPAGLAFDAATREALEEFERRHRIYARGSLRGPTLRALGTEPLELARQDVVRVLTERAMLTAGIVEDGSVVLDEEGQVRTYRTTDGRELPLRDLEAELSRRVEEAFGLEDAESALEWLDGLGNLPADANRWVAIDMIELPPYYAPHMELRAEIDRGDVWYEFPYDEQGRPIPQPVERRPTLTLYVEYNGQRIPLVRHGTTIGGWRVQHLGGQEVWVYKDSPVGERVWGSIVSAPVWIPPVGVPAESLVMQLRRVADGEIITEVNQNIVGPGYASAYGLVAAYHRAFTQRPDGSFDLGRDEGIRTHGSVDYTSIWRRASLGCHRLHNHLAVRFFTFILKHRRHRRVGQRDVTYRIPVQLEDFEGQVRIDRTGYRFELTPPMVVDVKKGRIRGALQEPVRQPIPREPDPADDGSS